MEQNENKTSISRQKMIWIIIGLSLDVILTILFLILSIILVVRLGDKNSLALSTNGFDKMLYTMMEEPNLILGCVVTPLIVLFIINIVITFLYFHSHNNEEKKSVKVDYSSLSEEEKEQLKKELLAELAQKRNNKEDK